MANKWCDNGRCGWTFYLIFLVIISLCYVLDWKISQFWIPFDRLLWGGIITKNKNVVFIEEMLLYSATCFGVHSICMLFCVCVCVSISPCSRCVCVHIWKFMMVKRGGWDMSWMKVPHLSVGLSACYQVSLELLSPTCFSASTRPLPHRHKLQTRAWWVQSVS